LLSTGALNGVIRGFCCWLWISEDIYAYTTPMQHLLLHETLYNQSYFQPGIQLRTRSHAAEELGFQSFRLVVDRSLLLVACTVSSANKAEQAPPVVLRLVLNRSTFRSDRPQHPTGELTVITKFGHPSPHVLLFQILLQHLLKPDPSQQTDHTSSCPTQPVTAPP
jgi:hypothetical protein